MYFVSNKSFEHSIKCRRDSLHPTTPPGTIVLETFLIYEKILGRRLDAINFNIGNRQTLIKVELPIVQQWGGDWPATNSAASILLRMHTHCCITLLNRIYKVGWSPSTPFSVGVILLSIPFCAMCEPRQVHLLTESSRHPEFLVWTGKKVIQIFSISTSETAECIFRFLLKLRYT